MRSHVLPWERMLTRKIFKIFCMPVIKTHDNQSLIQPKREGGDGFDMQVKSKEAIYTNSTKYQNLDRQLGNFGFVNSFPIPILAAIHPPYDQACMAIFPHQT